MYDIDLMFMRACGLLPRGLGSFGRHAHDEYEFHYLIGGRGAFEMPGRRLAVRAGDLFYTRPGTEHQLVVPAESDYVLQYVAFLEFDPNADAECASDLATRFGEGVSRHLGRRHHAFFAHISQLCAERDPRRHRAAAFKFVGILYELLADAPLVYHSHPAVVEALAFMRAKLDDWFTLEDIVAHVGLDKSYFVRVFKKHVGEPPMKYAMHLKMSAAADLLHSTSDPLAMVAARVGFADEYHFAKRFKQWSGVAPGVYRRQV